MKQSDGVTAEKRPYEYEGYLIWHEPEIPPDSEGKSRPEMYIVYRPMKPQEYATDADLAPDPSFPTPHVEEITWYTTYDAAEAFIDGMTYQKEQGGFSI